MYLSFGLFFFWRKSGTVVVVGVLDVFFALRVDWLFDFFEERKKQCANFVRGLQKV